MGNVGSTLWPATVTYRAHMCTHQQHLITVVTGGSETLPYAGIA